MFIAGLFVTMPVLATTYSREVEVQFTFNSEIQIDIDTADIEILDLTPGQQKDSNVVGILVSTNNVAGYTVSATTGNTTYNNTDMTHSDGVNKFTSISTDANESTLSTDNTWGYSTSMGSSQSWANFSGLPIYTDTAKEIAKTDGPSTDLTKFKIHAKASTSQPAGNYRNVITFNVVANVPPRDWEDVDPCLTDSTKCDSETGRLAIQNVNGVLCDLVETFDTQFQVTDLRDHKDYWISKLRDGNCWMTQNLDLDLKAGVALTSEKTDLGWNGSGYNTAEWMPSKTTRNLATSTGDAWMNENPSTNSSPYSADPGDWYQKGEYFAYLESGACNYPLNSSGCTDTISSSPYTTNGEHGHIGNYYTWAAAIAVDNASTESSTAQNSICPTNWRLPDGTNDDFSTINRTYNSGSSTTDKNLFESPIYFVRNGFVSGGSLTNVGTMDTYWTNEAANVGQAYLFFAYNNSLQTKVATFTKAFGLSVRCVTHKTSPFIITFNSNGGEGSMNSQSINRGTSAPLTQNTFTRSGYIFNGWNTQADGLGTGYGNGASYSVASSEQNAGTTLYARWIKDDGSEGGIPDGQGGYRGDITIGLAYELAYTEHGKTEYKGHFKMQDINLTYNGVKVCDLVTVIGDDYIAIDSRDDKLYHITKTKDGNCWMTQNLDFDLASNKSLSSTTSDLTAYGVDMYSSNYGYSQDSVTGEITWEPLNSTITESGAGLITDWHDDNYRPYSLDVGDWYWVGAWDNNGTSTYYGSGTYNYLKNETGGKFSRTPFAGNGTHGHVGNYYNLPAAIASNYTHDFLYDAGTYNADNSICPANWRLPTSDYDDQSSNEFITLLNSYSAYVDSGYERDKKIVSSPLWFVRGGFIQENASLYNSNLIYPGLDGNYQSRRTNLLSSYTFNYNYAIVRPDYSGYNSAGRSIRCVAR